MKRCGHSGGVGIGAGHECRCVRQADHPLDGPRPHGCECGALWADTTTDDPSTSGGMAVFADLSPPYSTIVADPPWDLGAVNSGWRTTSNLALPYSTMSLDEIAALPVADLAAKSSHLYLWTVTSVLRHSFEIVEAWGYKPKQVLVWCKPGLGSGMRFRQNVEYVVFGTRGNGLPITRRDVGTWHEWPRGAHSAKPPPFMDLVETVSPGPYLELFARAPRLGWDSWGHGYEIGESA